MELLVNNPRWLNFAAGLEADRGLAPGLLRAVALNESAGAHPDYVGRTSSAGAKGMFQFIEPTAKQYNVNVQDHADSTRGAADFLGDLSKKYGDPLLAGAAYNWGPANLDKAMRAAAGAGVATDALSLVNHGYLPRETAAYVAKLATNLTPAQSAAQKFSPDVIKATRAAVVDLYQQGASSTAIVQSLARSPVASMIEHLTSAGVTPDDIVSQVGGQPLQEVRAAQAKVEGQGFLTNLAQGAQQAVGDLGSGLNQVGARLSGDDARLHELQLAEAARQTDASRRALSNTAGGTVGNLGVRTLPYLAAGLLPMGIPAMVATQAGVGAVDGALTPTTGEGQIATNVGLGALLGGGGAVAGAGVGKLLGKASNILSATDTPERQATIAAARAQGLPVAPASVSPFWRGVADSMPENSSVKAFHAKADQALASKIAEGLGVGDWRGGVDSDLLQTASAGIKHNLDAATNVNVTLPQSLRAELQPLVTGSTNPLTEGIATNSVVKRAVANLLKAVDDGTPVAGRALQELNSELKALTQSPAASATERQLAGQLVGKVSGVLTDSMTPEEATAFKLANKQYANLKAVENMVRATNDSGTVTPRQIVAAAKSGRFRNQFLKGEAPFQELGTAAADLYGPANGKGLGDIVGRALADHDHLLTGAAIVEPATGIPVLLAKKIGSMLAGKLATSENPTVLRLLAGSTKGLDPTTIAYISKALGSSGAAVHSR